MSGSAITLLMTYASATLLKRVCLSAPVVQLDSTSVETFALLFQQALAAGPHCPMPYTAPYPKHVYLRYLAEHKNIVLHSSSHRSRNT